MRKAAGRTLPISPFRRLVIDLMHFGRQVPAVTVERRMDLSRLVAARAAAPSRPSWTAVFAKAYSLLGRDYPELRRSYLSFPWARLYEHPHNIVALNVERRLPGEDVVPLLPHPRPREPIAPAAGRDRPPPQGSSSRRAALRISVRSLSAGSPRPSGAGSGGQPSTSAAGAVAITSAPSASRPLPLRGPACSTSSPCSPRRCITACSTRKAASTCASPGTTASWTVPPQPEFWRTSNRFSTARSSKSSTWSCVTPRRLAGRMKLSCLYPLSCRDFRRSVGFSGAEFLRTSFGSIYRFSR